MRMSHIVIVGIATLFFGFLGAFGPAAEAQAEPDAALGAAAIATGGRPSGKIRRHQRDAAGQVFRRRRVRRSV